LSIINKPYRDKIKEQVFLFYEDKKQLSCDRCNPYVLQDFQEKNNKWFFRSEVDRRVFREKEIEKTPFTSNLSLYIFLLPNNIRKTFIELMNILDIDKCVDSDHFINKLAAVSECFKVLGNELSEYWRYFHGIHSIFYYLPVVKQDMLRDNAREWLEKEVELTINNDKKLWDINFSKAIDFIFDNEFDHSLCNETISVDKYLSQYKWLKGAAVDQDGVLIFDHKKDKIINSRKTKKSASLRIQKDILKTKIMSLTPQVMKVFQKSEGGKRRLIVNGDFNNFLKMDYLSTYLDKGFSRHKNMSVLNNMDMRKKMYEDMVIHGKRKDEIKLPLDQSKFDHYVTRNMLMKVFSKIIDIMPVEHEYKKVAQMLYQSMFDVGSIVINGSDIFNYVKGIASGWRWTALLDTIINYAEFLVIKNLHDTRYLTVPDMRLQLICANFQGDDARLVLKGKKTAAVALMDLYGECGLKVNKQKNFIAYDRDEFLKMVAEGNKLTGYPARVILSLTNYKPQSDEVPNFLDRINDVANNCMRAIRRGLDRQRVKFYIDSYLKKKEINGKDFYGWLFTPNSLGGYGLPVNDPFYGVCDNIGVWTCIKPTIIRYNNKIIDSNFDEKCRIAKKYFHIDDRILYDKAIEILPKINRGVEVISRSHFEEVKDYDYGYKLSPSNNESMRSIYCNYIDNEYFHPQIWESIKDTAIMNIDDSTLSRLLTPESYEQFRIMIKFKHSARLIKMWLSNKIKVNYPQSSIYDPLMHQYISKIAEDRLRDQLSRRNCTYKDYQRAALTIELTMHSDITKLCNARSLLICN